MRFARGSKADTKTPAQPDKQATGLVRDETTNDCGMRIALEGPRQVALELVQPCSARAPDVPIDVALSVLGRTVTSVDHRC
jgi:hypothetical protein